jgi:hypothetical protein
MSGSMRRFIGGGARIDSEVRRKLEDLAGSRIPLSWELVEDHGLFGLFQRPGPPPTAEEVRALIASLPPQR